MNKKKNLKKIFAASLTLAAGIALVSCRDEKVKDYTVSFSTDGGTVYNDTTVTKGKTVDLTKYAPTKDGYVFEGWYTDDAFTTAFTSETKVTGDLTLYAKWVKAINVTFESNGGTAVTKAVVAKGKTVTRPADPTKEAVTVNHITTSYTFAGWYTEATLENEFSFSTALDADITLYAKWTEVSAVEDGMAIIKYEVDFNDAIANKAANAIGSSGLTIKNVFLSEGITLDGDGSTTIDGVSYKRIKGIKGSPAPVIDGDVATTLPTKQYIKVSIGGAGKIKLYYAPGGSGDRNLYVIDKDNKVLLNKSNDKSSTATSVELEFDSANEIIICASNGHNFYKIDTEYVTELGDQVGVEVSNKGVVDYLEGMDYDGSKVEVKAVYSSGATKILSPSDYQIDSSAFNKTIPGIYDVKVKCQGYDDLTIPVNVYETENIELSLQYMEKDSANKWGNNTTLRNVDTQEIYFSNGDLNLDGLVVTANTTLPTTDKTKKFILSSSYYAVTSDMTSASGSYTATVTATINGKEFTNNYDVYLVLSDPAIASDTVTVTVDKDYTGVIGENVTGQGNTFTSFKQAIEFLTYHPSISDAMKKVINVKEGYYFEKVDIDIPNVSIIGENAETTIIEFNAANGLNDANNLAYGTDGSSTFALRDSADNFYAEGITFSSYYNTLERFNALKAKTSGTQALAIMIQSDRAVFNDCKFLGYQDTIEMQGAGRVYYYDCFIQGATDFIFGTNTSALFEECEIYVISNGQSDNGGYICAPKGNNKGDDQAKFGYIFNNCDFTSDGDTPNGTTSIARPWANYAYITIMNSRLGAHISKAAYDGKATKGLRYVTGLGGDPNASTVIFQEYNNTGDGAITTAVAPAKIITAAQATTLLNSFWTAYNISTYSFEAWAKPTLVTKLSAPILTVSGTTVSWSAVDNAVSYDIYVDGAKVASQSELTFDVNVTGSESKNVYVIAVADGTHYKNSVASNIVTVALTSTPLQAPVVIAGTGNNISWAAVDNAVSYDVYVDGAKVGSTELTNYVIETTENKTVSVRVKAIAATTDTAHDDSELSTAVEVNLVIPYYVGEDTTINFCTDGNYTSIVNVSNLTVTESKTNTVGFSGSLSFVVPANALVTINGFSGYVNYTIDGVLCDTIRTIYTTEQKTITIVAGSGNNYLQTIIVDVDADAPAAATVSSVDINGQKTVFESGSTFTVGDTAVVKAKYSDGRIVTLSSDEYTVAFADGVLSTDNKFVSDGTFVATVTVGTATKTYEVVVGNVDTSIKTDTVLQFNSTYSGDITNVVTWANNKATGTMSGFTISGNNYTNSGYLEFKNDDLIGFDVTIATGKKAVLVISSYEDVESSVLSGTNDIDGTKTNNAANNYQYTYEITETSTITIEATEAQNYLNYISIVFVDAE